MAAMLLPTGQNRGRGRSHNTLHDTRGQRGGAKCFCSPAQHCW